MIRGTGSIYLDWNATTPPHPSVLELMRDAAGRTWGNPASVHAAGRAAKAVVEQAREKVADLVGTCPRDVIFTSGGTEANNLALVRPFDRADGTVRGTLVTSRLEHPSIVVTAEALAQRGLSVLWLNVPECGRIDPDGVGEVLSKLDTRERPALVAIQAVNHETGVIQPIGAIADLVHRYEAELHVDAVQAAGKLDPAAWHGADTLSIAAHKLRGPKGIGALAVRAGIVPRPLLRGGSQERGYRPGTLDPVLAAGFGAAAERAQDAPRRYRDIEAMRDGFERDLELLGARVGQPVTRHGQAQRVAHVTNLRFGGWKGEELVAALDLEGICVASGSACAAGTSESSPVIAAMCGPQASRGAVRISLGDTTTEEELRIALIAFFRVLSRQSGDL